MYCSRNHIKDLNMNERETFKTLYQKICYTYTRHDYDKTAESTDHMHSEWHCQLVAVVGGTALPHCVRIPGVQPQQVELSRGREFRYKEQDQAPKVTCGSSMEGHATYAATGQRLQSLSD